MISVSNLSLLCIKKTKIVKIQTGVKIVFLVASDVRSNKLIKINNLFA